jgi:hypothetical protein
MHTVIDIPAQPIADERTNVVHKYGDPNALFAVYESLRRNGLKPTCIIREAARLSVQYREPDGTTVELRCDSLMEPIAA